MGSTRGTNASNGFQHSKVYGTHKGEITTGTHVNGQFLTTAEENERFRRQNKVATTYKGPVYVSEDTHTLCNGCGTPVDPVTRVPVGQLFFHPACVRCNLCGKTGVAEPFYQYGYSVVCSDCVYKGHTPFVNPEEAERRGMVLGAIRGDPQKVFHQQDEQRRLMNQPNRRVHSQFGHSGAGATVNQTSVQDATPPTLTISSGLHDPRNTSTRSFQLMQRQQYYTQNDWNVRTMMPPERTRNRSSSRKSSPKPEIANKDDTLALEDRGSQPTNE
ncbi:hypothetical protein AGDE_13214 [Angomonas deanei]|uniref:LIM domain containing protein, putative n=1 Tax=Angomonas deanei TaxID=59799 RepID=A0A7G2CR41_9TRYP|nr:hypothetical protein AGDE_13214 [Angomonas deanei]CAD2221454.1 LIM domain containing protein, putative [Angomonas deanei]|eukprot:EPY22611.1 hypothetical protein AGDE_13214 [Angomonas deanei]